MTAILSLILLVLAISIVRRLIRRLVRRGVDAAVSQIDGSDRGLYVSLALGAVVVGLLLLPSRRGRSHEVPVESDPQDIKGAGRSATASVATPSPRRDVSNRDWVDQLRSDCFMNNEEACLEIADAYERALDPANAAPLFEMACKTERSFGCVGLIRTATALFDRGDLSGARRPAEKACQLHIEGGCELLKKTNASKRR